MTSDAIRKAMSRFGSNRNDRDSLDFAAPGLGQSYPQHCPPPEEKPECPSIDPLGPPMTIRAVAAMLGCSVWTVRQRFLPLGLPHLRISRSGKLTFYRNQVVRWVLARQKQKGGRP